MVGRYELHGEIGAGGMARVHLGKLTGDYDFSGIVAIKRMRKEVIGDPDAVCAFVDEARLLSRIDHPNVVRPLDVVARKGEILLVMEYVHGETLRRLMRGALTARMPVPVEVAVAVMTGVLEGLHHAHEARHKQGALLGIVHRDVTPENIVVTSDGVGHVLDLGSLQGGGELRRRQRDKSRASSPTWRRRCFADCRGTGEPTSTLPGWCCERCSPGAGSFVPAGRQR